MHSNLLNNINKTELSIELKNKLEYYYCRDYKDAYCINNGIKSVEKYDKIGFKFIISDNSCKYFIDNKSKLIHKTYEFDENHDWQ